MLYGVTGHRPPKLGGYNEATTSKLVKHATNVLSQFTTGSEVITGMALGWDQAVAYAAYRMGMPYHAYVPHHDYCAKWPRDSQEWFYKLLSKAASMKIVCPGEYEVSKLFKRNEAIVDDCDTLITLWDGQPEGGTWRCINYAKHCDKPMIHTWREWMAL